MNTLQNMLYKETNALRRQLEADWAIGNTGKGYHLPTMAAGCMYNRVRFSGFSGKKGEKRRNDIKPFEPMLKQELLKQDPSLTKVPDIVWYKQKVYNPNTGKVVLRQFVDKFVGTCAEDNAANCVLIETKGWLNKPNNLKVLQFTQPIRVRTFKKERMCKVCRNIFTEL